MSSALYSRGNAIIPALGATTLVDKEGYTCTLGVVSSSLTATLGASATVPSTGVILEGVVAAGLSSIGILGTLDGPVRLKTSGAIVAGARVQQAADGSIVTDAGTGARVVIGVAIESGASGDLIEVATFTPLTLS
jgi:hypothetical protein